MKVEYAYLPLEMPARSAWRRDVLHDIKRLMDDGDFTLGWPLTRFEDTVCQQFGVRHCIGVNSGTDALFLTLKAMGVGSGDSVLTVPNTFIATVGAILAAGARPVFCDVGADYLMDLEKGVHRRVKAAIPVHLTGLARNEQLWPLVINDAAQAVGAEWDGLNVANFAHASCFSLHPLKNAHGAGDGGFVTTNDQALASELKLLRNHGLLGRDDVLIPGYNSRLDSIQAIFAYHSLLRVEETNERRRSNGARYDDGLRDCPGVDIPPRDPRALPVYHTYVVKVRARAALTAFLAKRGVQAKVHYPTPLHLQPALIHLGYRRGDFPVAEEQADRILSLPVNEFLTNDQLDHVVDCVREFYHTQRWALEP